MIPLLVRTADRSAYFEYSTGLTDAIRIEAYQAPGFDDYQAYSLSVVDPSSQIGNVGVVRLLENGEAPIAFGAGWNLVGLPVKPFADLDSATFLTRLAAGGVDAIQLARWRPEAGRYDIYLGGSGGPSWPVELGKGYFARVANAGGTVTLAGKRLVEPVRLDITMAGWNALAVPFSREALDSEGLLQMLVRNGVDAIQIVKWEGGRWHVHARGSDFGIWAIQPDRGYFVRLLSLGLSPPATPTPAPFFTPAATPTPAGVAAYTATVTATATVTITPTPWPAGVATYTATITPTATSTPQPPGAITHTPTRTPTATLTVTPTPGVVTSTRPLAR